MVRICRGFGMDVIGWDAYPNEDFAHETGMRFVSKDEVFERSDVISLHAPLLPTTHHLAPAWTMAYDVRPLQTIDENDVATPADWEAVAEAIEEYQRGDDLRGASSITQQLVKNLFLTTHSTYVRKALEVPLTYAAELVLSKRRILSLYVNVIEWGPGVYGAEAAAQFHYDHSARQLTRAQAAGLAAGTKPRSSRTSRQIDAQTAICLFDIGRIPTQGMQWESAIGAAQPRWRMR